MGPSLPANGVSGIWGGEGRFVQRGPDAAGAQLSGVCFVHPARRAARPLGGRGAVAVVLRGASMRVTRCLLGALPAAAFLLGLATLAHRPAIAEPPDFCPQPPGPPGFDCRACPTFVDPVVCTVICAGGPTQKSFSNSCFAACSGYKIQGECTRTGG